MAIGITLVVLVLAWYGLEFLRHRTRAMPGGIDEGRTLPHEGAWELYHNSFSLCSKKTRVCLAELGIEYRSHHVDLIETGAYENVSRRYLAINPAALVPLLVHRGHPIYESHEQIVYAAAAVGESELLTPEDEVDWLDTFLTEARPRVAAYWKALQARPSYAAAIGAFEHPTVVRGLDRVRHLKETDAAFRAALTG